MPVQIKICGLSTPEAVEAAITVGATHIGLNFYPPSPRFLIPDQAARLAALAGARIAKVGLFVDAEDALMTEGISAGSLDAIQLHGDESPERTAHVRERFGLPVWKVLPVASAEDVGRADAYRESADLILFDAKTPAGALPGGMGMSFDWSLLEACDKALPWGLAGGLTPANIAEAIRITGAPLVDTSSGVESGPGVKDVDLIAAFCKAAHEA